MTADPTVKVTLTLFGETREVETEGFISHHRDEREGTVWPAPVSSLVGQIGRGSARYPATLLLNRLYDGDRKPFGTTEVTDSEGRRWTFHLQTCIRNRQAR